MPIPDSDRFREMRPGLLLIAATLAALLLVNSAADTAYHNLLTFSLGPLSMHEWVADGLLVVFFFVTGVELRAEFTHGSLASPRRAIVPVAAALGGMAVPALIYVLCTSGALPFVGPDAGAAGQLHGWAIPTATDIAFAVSLLALVAPGLPASARAFLLALAVADDLFAIIIIAVFYTGGTQLIWLAAAVAAIAAFWVVMHILPKLRPRSSQRQLFVAVAVALAIAAWWCTLRSGVHPTIAGVALGLAVAPDASRRTLRTLQPISTWLAVPAFAFVSAGVPVSLGTVAEAGADPVFLGVFFGLVVGKPVGIIGMTWLVLRLTRVRAGARTRGRAARTREMTRAQAADGPSVEPSSRQAVSWPDLWVVALLAGVGFTVSLLVTQLAFTGSDAAAMTEHIDHATIAVLAASLTAAMLAALAHRLLRRRVARQGASVAGSR